MTDIEWYQLYNHSTSKKNPLCIYCTKLSPCTYWTAMYPIVRQCPECHCIWYWHTMHDTVSHCFYFVYRLFILYNIIKNLLGTKYRFVEIFNHCFLKSIYDVVHEYNITYDSIVSVYILLIVLKVWGSDSGMFFLSSWNIINEIYLYAYIF